MRHLRGSVQTALVCLELILVICIGGITNITFGTMALVAVMFTLVLAIMWVLHKYGKFEEE